MRRTPICHLHEHEYAYLSFPLSGAYDEFCGSQQRTCLPGAAVFHPRGEAHRDQFHGRGAAIFSVEFDDIWLDRLRDDAVQCDTRYDVKAAVVARARTGLYTFAGAIATKPGAEAELTRDFLLKKNLHIDGDLVVARFQTLTDPTRRSELIVFYWEDLATAGLTRQTLDKAAANAFAERAKKTFTIRTDRRE